MSESNPDTSAGLPMGARVDISGWGWRHGGRKAWTLDGVDLAIAPGERVLVLGPSGSGKSTLMAGLAGLLGGEDEGEARGSLTVDGADPTLMRGRIGLVMQDPEAQVVLARCGDDVAFGMENLRVPREEIWPRVRASIDEVGLDVALDRSTSALSGGQKQRLALASVMTMQPGLLLLDEPTANLDPAGVVGVRDAVERVLADSQATLVVIEHRVDVWKDLVDRVVVVLDGRIAADGPVELVLAEQGQVLRERGIWLPGDDVAAEALATNHEGQQQPSEFLADDPIMTLRGLSIGYSPLHPVRSDINLDIPRGVSTCIVGANGLGKSTLALTIAGLLESLAGTVAMHPSTAADTSPTSTLAGAPSSQDPHDWKSAELLGRISMVFQEPEYQFVARTVREELEVGPRKAGIDGDQLAALVDEHLSALGLLALAGANPMTLSGGEKRRLSVATALISAPELLILDEPTFGQDRRTWLELVRLLRRARQSGTTLVSITHDPAFVAAMGDNVIDFADYGTAVGAGVAGEPSNSGTPQKPATPTPPAKDAQNPREGRPKLPRRTPKTFARDAQTAATTRKRRSLLDLVNPVTQVLALMIITTPLLITIDAVSAGTALALEMILLVVSRIPLKKFALRMIPLFIAAPLAALSMLLYANPGGDIHWQFGPAIISDRSMLLAMGILVRVLAVGTPAIVLLSRIDPTDMGDGMAQVLRLPARPVLATLAAARMTGLMAADWKALEQARRIRGIGDAHKIISAVRGSFSLLVFALRRSAKLSLTMEARGFGAAKERTWARESRVGVADAVMLAIAVAIPAIALTAAIVTGNFELIGR